jgi:hypothetical protein
MDNDPTPKALAWGRPEPESWMVGEVEKSLPTYRSKCGRFKIVRLSEGTPYEDAVFVLYGRDGIGYPTRILRDAKYLAERVIAGVEPADVHRILAKPCRHNPNGGLGRTIPMKFEVPSLT